MPWSRVRFGGSALALLVAASCAAPRPAENLEPVETGGAYQAQYRKVAVQGEAVARSTAINASRCLPHAGGPDARGAGGLAALRGELLSPGDLVHFGLPDDVTFSGDYEISRDGRLKLPFLDPIPAQGRSPEQVAEDIRRALQAKGFYDEVPDLALLVKDFAAVRVAVSGAVFEPQAMAIGQVSGDEVDTLRAAALGASTEGRNLSVAVRRAGGVRPDADLSAVRLTRNGTSYMIDMRGAIVGAAFDDVMLVAGDEVVVPSRGCFQEDLMAPGPISPPGVSLYLSNLTQPAAANAASGIGDTVREVPWGTRFLQAVIDANCVGGARTTSADRSAVLFSRNPLTGASVVVERPVELLRVRADRDDYDPYLLPGDAIACYDSGLTNVSEVARLLGVVGAVAALP